MVAVVAQAHFHNGSQQLAAGQPSNAAHSFQQAINAGHAEAHAALAFMHYGTYSNMPKNPSTSFHLASAGAKMGCVHSKGALADCLMFGVGTAAAVADGLRMATESADAGSLYGQHVLAVAYQRGRGVPRDDAKAVALFKLAAAQGEVHSHDWLGMMYDRGLGVERSEVEALRWWNRAAAMGYEISIQRLRFRDASST